MLPLSHSLDYWGMQTNLGDLNGDGISDIAIGAYGDDDGGTDTVMSYYYS